MASGHPRPGISHHLADAFARLGPVTVDRTVRTRGFVGAIGAEVQLAVGVVGELEAFSTQIATTVMVRAVHLDHQPHRLAFPPESS